MQMLITSSRILFLSAIFLATGLIPSITHAEKVYKSVDDNGNVSYSSSPPASNQTLKTITVPPPPSDKDVRSAKQRHQQNLRTEKIYSDSRQAREQKFAEDARIRKEKQEQYNPPPPYKEPKEEGPYYGVPGRGILVLPKGPRLRSPTSNR